MTEHETPAPAPDEKRYSLRLPATLAKAVRIAAATREESMNAWLIRAAREQLERETKS